MPTETPEAGHKKRGKVNYPIPEQLFHSVLVFKNSSIPLQPVTPDYCTNGTKPQSLKIFPPPKINMKSATLGGTTQESSA